MKHGSIEYFRLLDLQEKLKSDDYDKLGLNRLDSLRSEIYIKVEQINLKHKLEKERKL